jgi:hypothetical protein
LFKHKGLLYKPENFILKHGGNAKKILEDKEIKTAKYLNISGFGGYRGKNFAFDEVFFQFYFPGRNIEESENFFAPARLTNRQKGEAGQIYVDVKILDTLAKLGKNIHFANSFAYGGCGPSYCIEWDKKYSLKENLNHIYHFILKNNYDYYIKSWKQKSSEKLSFAELREKILDFDEEYSNEIVIEGNVPLVIQKKNYILDYEFSSIDY